MIKCPVCGKKVDDKDNYCPTCAWEFEYFFDELSKEERKKYEDKLNIHKGVYLKYIEKETFTDKEIIDNSEIQEAIDNYISLLNHRNITSISLWFISISLILNFIFSYDASFMSCPEYNSEYTISILPRSNMFNLFIINSISLIFIFASVYLSIEFCIKEEDTFISENIYKKYNIYSFYNKKLIIDKISEDTENNTTYQFRLVNIDTIIEKKDKILKALNKSNIFWRKVHVLTIIIFLLNIGIFFYWLKNCADSILVISMFQLFIVLYLKRC